MKSLRLAPTLNGYMHLGHCYAALVNQTYAKERGWRFNVRFDDMQHQYLALNGLEGLAKIRQGWEEDLAWLGLEVSAYSSDRELHRKAFCILHTKRPGLLLPDLNALVDELDFPVGCAYYPYVPELTALKVVTDHMQEVGCLIRGDDLLTEYALYRYFEDLLCYERPIPQVFLPRLKLYAGSEVKNTASSLEISKTVGNLTIRKLREQGFTPDEVRFIVEDSCLLEPNGNWTLANLKPQPTYNSAKWGPYVSQAR